MSAPDKYTNAAQQRLLQLIDLLAVYGGCNSEEMAVMLGLPEATVLQMIYAAKRNRAGK